MIIPLIVLGLIWVLAAAIFDLKTREIPNWLNFSLVAFALAYRALYSVLNNDTGFFLWGLFGFIVFFILANVFYYTRIFAGGDTKLLIGLGPILPLASTMQGNLLISGAFIFLLLLIGSVYGVLFSVALSFKHKQRFFKEFKKQFAKSNMKKFFIISLICALLLFVFILSISIEEPILFVLPIIFLILPFIFVYAKSIEEACMIKKVPVNKLTEGDWLYENIKIGKQRIKANWQGLTLDELSLIKKSKIKSVLIKQGIPFVPVFLIAFVIFIYLFFSGCLNLFLFV